MAQNKKLIIFIPSIEDGGVEKNLFILLNYLEKKIKNITLLTYRKPKIKLKKNIKIISPSINFLNFKGRYPKYILCLMVLFKILLFDKKNTVLSFQANIFCIALCILLRIKIISRSNSSSAGWSQNKIKQIIFKYFFPKADKIIVNSLQFKNEMDKKYKIKTNCILNPFEFKKIKKLANEKCENVFEKKKLKLISIGRLTKQKDFMTLIKAIKNCQRKNVQLIIIGKGSEEFKLKKFVIENNLGEKIKFLGYKKNPFKYLKQADILILTSIFEGSPNVLVEAQYLRKFVISTDCPTGPKEILNNGEYGVLVNLYDYKLISKIIDNFVLNRNNMRKINLAYKKLDKYDYKKNCLSYFNLIKKYL